MVEIQKLDYLFIYDFRGAYATLCRDLYGRGLKIADFLRFLLVVYDRARRSALVVVLCEFVLVSANLLRRLCASRCGVV